MKGSKTESGPDEVAMDAIDQIFAEFELVYHNQYNKAYASLEKLHYAKKLWYSHLRGFDAETILGAAQQAIRESEYLPTVRTILKHCEASLQTLGLPAPRDAYIEACQATSPRAACNWSHAAVYWAGKDSNWFFLENNIERLALPVFEQHYRQYCRRVLQGETLASPSPPLIAAPAPKPLAVAQQREQLAKMRRKTGI